MGGDDMNYGMNKGDTSNISLLVEHLTAHNHREDENICNNENFEVEYILRPVAETTLREFIDTCVRNVSNFPEDWSLCTKDRTFNCDPVTDYVSACEVWRSKKCDPSEPCTMGAVMGQSSGLLILFSLVFIGILIGISVTIAACLICPQLHGWANKKVRGDYSNDNSKTHPSSVFHLEAIDSQNSTSSQYEPQLGRHYSDNQIPSMPNGDGDSMNEYTYIGVGGARRSGTQSITDYEGLKRDNSQQQSHKYAYLPQNTSEDRNSEAVVESGSVNESRQSPDYTHNYFVLERPQNQS